MKNTFIAGIYFAASLIIGCTVGPRYRPPELPIASDWHSLETSSLSNIQNEREFDLEMISDRQLNCLLKRALDQNLSVQIVGMRVLQARLAVKGKEADNYPRIDASLTKGYLYQEKEALLNTTVKSHSHLFKQNINFVEFGFDASWEIDLFGYLAHEKNAALAICDATEEDLCAVWITLSAEITRNYVELRGVQQSKLLLLRTLAEQQENVLLMKELEVIGTISSIECMQVEEQLHLLQAKKPVLDLSIDKLIHKLSILLGESPGALFLELSEPTELPSLPCAQSIGYPSDLLRNRPDIRKAERELAAATESVGSAIAALFPRFSLYGFVGEVTSQLKSLSNGQGATWFAAPQLLFPIFNSKLLHQDVKFNKLKAQEAFLQYKQTVLTALEEAENSIAALRYAKERNCALFKAKEINQHISVLTKDLCFKGFKDYASYLEANSALYAIEETYLQSQQELLLNYISLFKALGKAPFIDDTP